MAFITYNEGMLEYLKPIGYGLLAFPLLALLITIPYLLVHYHKYGSLPLIRVFIVYTFIMYLLVAFSLVIFPIPSPEELAQITGPKVQLIPLMFIKDLYDDIKELSFSHFYQAPAFYTVFFNFCLTIPFGVYLKFYFERSLKETILYTFLLSLVFELIQLTGVFFLYPSYRLFDVDDLLINTLGSIPGYYLGALVAHFMPSLDDVNREAINKGMRVSFLRRLVSFCLDFVLWSFFTGILHVFSKNEYNHYIAMILYYIVIPCRSGQTLANRFLNLRIVAEDEDGLSFKALLTRQLVFYFGVFYLPYAATEGMAYVLSFFTSHAIFRIMAGLIVIFIFFVYYLLLMIKLVSKDVLFYDKLSGTKIISTIVM